MYGTQASMFGYKVCRLFENDVKMYGTQARNQNLKATDEFENDVKMYGTQAVNTLPFLLNGLRMM